MLKNITPLILTFNEAPNIARTLQRLSWADDVVIVDSCSTDDTRLVAKRQHPGVRIFDRPFTTLAEQWTFGLRETDIKTEWVLALDADYVLTEALISELQQLTPADDVNGFRASFTYCVHGRPLQGGVYPPVVVLYRRARARYAQDGHAQRVQVEGRIAPLTAPILHDDRKPLAHWFWSQARYMKLEADKLLSAPSASLSVVDRVRKLLIVAPPAMFVYCLVYKRGLLDGWPGLHYALQRAVAEMILSLYLVDRIVFGNDAPLH